MLTEREKKELLEMAASESMRRDFRRLRAPRGALSAEEYLGFLTAFSGFCSAAAVSAPKTYSRALL